MQSVIHSCIVSHCVISRMEVIVCVHECENYINVAIRITVFTQASDSLFFFQPCSNKAEKFDYVSRRSFLSSSSLLRPWIYKTGLYSILHTYDLFFFVRQGHGVCEKDDRPRVCGIQQCHVSVLSNAFKVFYVNISLFCRANWKKQKQCQANCPFTALLHYWCLSSDLFCFSVSGSSQKKKRATETLPLDTTWKKRRSVTGSRNMRDYKCFTICCILLRLS